MRDWLFTPRYAPSHVIFAAAMWVTLETVKAVVGPEAAHWVGVACST